MKNKTVYIVYTAMLTALLVAVQWATSGMGQLVTGSCVNTVLGVSALVFGFWSALVVALVSPFCAFLLGIGPQLLPIVPAIAVGNLVFTAILCSFGKESNRKWLRPAAGIAASAAKFLVLHLLVVRLLCQILPLQEAQAAKFSAMFSWPQLVTALIGSAAAILIAPILRRSVPKNAGK